MAQHQISDIESNGFVSKSRATAASVAKSNGNVATPANYDNVAAMDARLAAISATTYSQSRLDTMTINDKVYALRVQDDAGTI